MKRNEDKDWQADRRTKNKEQRFKRNIIPGLRLYNLKRLHDSTFYG